MDVNKIFNLFNKEEPDSFQKKAQDVDILSKYKDHPLFWVGMFCKLIINHNNFKYKVIGFFSSLDEDLDIKDVKNAGEYILYDRSWMWIKNIDLKDEIHKESLVHYTKDNNLILCIKLSISHFQELEEYERCAHLKSIQDFIESL
jgi:hypothetical protein